MIVTSIRTEKVTQKQDIVSFLDTYFPTVKENSVIVVTSKIVSIAEGNSIPITLEQSKTDIMKKEADLYIEEFESQYHVLLTIKNSTLIANAGVDESNANGNYIPWPKDSFGTAKNIWNHFRKKHGVKNLGVIITDSRLTPLRWGTIGVGLSWCGFSPLKDYMNTLDIFGRPFVYQKGSIVDGLAAAAVVVMGEGSEQTPLAIITDVPFVEFQNHPPTQEEIDALKIDPKDDLYAPLLTSVKWKKGDK